MARYQWSALNRQQVGAWAEYFVKMELTMHGFQVYTTEVDDRGIDFVARYEQGPFHTVQVKSLRGGGYVFLPKHKTPLGEEYLLALALLEEGEAPRLYLIPGTRWREPDQLFVDREYEGLESDPEWGLNVSARNLEALAEFALERAVARLKAEACA